MLRTCCSIAILSMLLAPVLGTSLLAEEDTFIKDADREERIRQTGLTESDIDLAKKYRTGVGLFGVHQSNVLLHLVMTDEELWDWLPHAIQGRPLPRIAPGHDYGIGCPIHGKYSGDIRSTWKWVPERPYKVQCATGDEWLPTNDYGAYLKGGAKEKLDCQQPHVDDGWGCIVGGRRHWCAAAANYFLYAYTIQLRTDLTECWKKSGRDVFLHKAVIVWASIAKDYPLMDYGRQNVGAHPSWWLGKMTCWGYDDAKLADHFNDREMWAAIRRDEKLGEFLRARGIDGDLRTFIQKNVMMELYDACRKKDWFLSQGVGGERFQYIVQRWDNEDPTLGPTNDALARQAEGALWRNLYNNVYRDGINTEVSAAYGLMSQNQIAEILSARIQQGKPVPRTPRIRNTLSGSLRLILIDTYLPNIGDAPFTPYTPDQGRGSAMTGALAKGGKGTGEAPGLLLAYELFGDPTTGKWLSQLGQTGKHRESIRRVVEKEGDDVALGSRVLTAYGLGVLESGERGKRRAITLFWGPEGCGSHAHSDMLSVELFALGRPLAPDLGYPEETGSASKRGGWVAATVSHSTVVVDRRSSGRIFGALNTFQTFSGFHAVDVSAEPAALGGPAGPERMFRRQLALVDIDAERFYVIDVFRVQGGSQHDWVFHANHFEPPVKEGPVQAKSAEADLAPKASEEGDEADRLIDGKPEAEGATEQDKLPADFVRRAPVETTGLTLSNPRRWKTLADYQGSLQKKFGGSEYLHYPQAAQPTGDWSVTWAVDKAAKVRLTMLGGCARDVILADGEPVYREGAPKFIKYVLARNEGTSLTSRYTGLIEAFPSEPTILRVADLRPKDAPWDLVAMRIESTDRTDYYASSCLADRLHGFEPGIRFRGSQAFLSVRDGRVEQAILLADRPTKDSPALLEAFGVSIETASPIDGTVETSQPEAGTFTTRCDKLHEGLVGQIVLFGSSSRRCAYRLVGLQALGENRFRIELDADFIVGMSPVAKIEGRTATLSERITTYNGRFAGMTLTNEDGSATWRIAKSGTNEVTVMEDGPPLDAGKITDVDGDMDACLRVCDLGPGDEWWIPAAVHVSRQGGGYVVQARAESRLGLPKGAGLSRQEGSGAGRPIAPSSTTQETDTFLVRPGDH